MTSARSILLGAMLSVMLLSGCGAASQHSTDRARYVARAEQICRGAQAQTAAQIQQLSSTALLLAQGQLTAARARLAAPAAKRLQATAAALLARLRALTPPGGDGPRIERFLAPTASMVTSISAAAGALTLGDTTNVATTLQQVLSDGQRAQAAALSYGLKQCATAVLPAGF